MGRWGDGVLYDSVARVVLYLVPSGCGWVLFSARNVVKKMEDVVGVADRWYRTGYLHTNYLVIGPRVRYFGSWESCDGVGWRSQNIVVVDQSDGAGNDYLLDVL